MLRSENITCEVNMLIIFGLVSHIRGRHIKLSIFVVSKLAKYEINTISK